MAMEARVQDFLDDKIQSVTDLDSLDVLLESVKAQQDLLKKQLENARRDHNNAQDAADKWAGSVQDRAQAFQGDQEDIDRRLLVVTQSDTSDEAVQKFESSMSRLRKLDVAAGYVELLKEMDLLKNACVAKLGKDDDAALEPYTRLQQLVASLQPLQDTAEGAAPHLLDHLAASVRDLRRTIQKTFSENLGRTLAKMNWPKSTDRIALALEKEWHTDIGRLLNLQKQELEQRENNAHRDLSIDPPALLALEVLVQPLEQRFFYHFSGDKPTNRLEKPEYFLNHVSDLIARYSDFVQANVQPILLRHFRRSDLAFTPAYIDASSAFITALMPMAKEKLNASAYQVAEQPSLLSHLVQEVIKFDTILQESYSYTPNSPSMPWRGLSSFLLDTRDYFPKWLAAEKDFALSRYQAIVESPDAGDIDYDSVASDVTKPTKAAVRVNDLLETITERYRSLSGFSHKIRFLVDIQIEIFDQYYRRLQSSLEAYLSVTTTVGRTVKGLTKEDLAKVQGVKGLDRICRVFGSADYLERAMRDWSDDVFFLELWAELDYRSKNREKLGSNMGSWLEVRQKTSSGLGTENEGGLEGALFDETASAYHRARVKSENILVEAIIYDVRQALKPYAAISTWASLSSSSTGGDSVSAELDAALGLLNEYLGFLRKAISKAPLRRISRQICHVVQTFIWDNVLQSRTSFSTAGATQLTTDMRAICSTVDRYIGAGQAQVGMRRLLEGVTLLSLPVRSEIQRVRPSRSGVDDQDESGSAWDNTNNEVEAEGEDGTKMSLFQAERLVFRDNEGSRHALDQLGLETLTEADARSVLGKRVEISS